MDGKTLNFREKHAALINISGNDGLFFSFLLRQTGKNIK
jgi:hypothetical protein